MNDVGRATTDARKRAVRIGLALGGGAARGAAHIGVIDALRRHGVPIHCVAGCSAGSIVAAAFAAGTLDRLREMALAVRGAELARFADFTWGRGGLLRGGRIQEVVREVLGDRTFAELNCPLILVATDLRTGETVYLDSGPVAEAVRASISVPGLFAPVRVGNWVLVDGGLSELLPVRALSPLGADVTIGSDVSSESDLWTRAATFTRVQANALRAAMRNLTSSSGAVRRLGLEQLGRLARGNGRVAAGAGRDDGYTLFRTVLTCFDIVEARLSSQGALRPAPDILIRPQVADVDGHQFHRAAECIAAGERAVQETLPRLGALTAIVR